MILRTKEASFLTTYPTKYLKGSCVALKNPTSKYLRVSMESWLPVSMPLWVLQDQGRHREPLLSETCTLYTVFYRLLDILADRKAKNGITGTVVVDGRLQPSNFRFISGYVVQVCNLYTLNVLKCIAFCIKRKLVLFNLFIDLWCSLLFLQQLEISNIGTMLFC